MAFLSARAFAVSTAAILAGAVGGAGHGYQDQVSVIRNCLAGRGYRVLN